ncbi:hypothetical protein Cgig2_020332 [Carnegiea gigantea]|uniref:Pentatricopeptide repeat-containing protein n=1 Tax=Carnegiea gigantea TaxID=171969 RepID=A0A9Q1KBJ1_9CARY|nr:hypothetical protein Cgig2_020332 [Carnegiea gigantea]
MREEDVHPTHFTISSVLNACGSLSLFRLGRQVHSLVLKQGLVSHVFVLSSLIDMYSKSGSTDDARSVFDQTIERNSVLWTSMISGSAYNGRAIEGLELFGHVVENGCLPDHICFTAVFTACNHAGLLNKAVEYFDGMRRSDEIDKMPFNPNCVMLSSLLSCCRAHGAVDMGRKVACHLFQLQPNNAAA